MSTKKSKIIATIVIVLAASFLIVDLLSCNSNDPDVINRRNAGIAVMLIIASVCIIVIWAVIKPSKITDENDNSKYLQIAQEIKDGKRKWYLLTTTLGKTTGSEVAKAVADALTKEEVQKLHGQGKKTVLVCNNDMRRFLDEGTLENAEEIQKIMDLVSTTTIGKALSRRVYRRSNGSLYTQVELGIHSEVKLISNGDYCIIGDNEVFDPDEEVFVVKDNIAF